MASYRALFLLLPAILVVALGEEEPLSSRWSTEDLDWTQPSNVTILEFGDQLDLQWARPVPLILRVYEGDACAAADADEHRGLWWAEVRRHAPLEEAIQVGQIRVDDLPAPVNAAMLRWNEQTAPGSDCRSAVAFFPAGSDGSDLSLAPADAEGMRSFIDWARERMRIGCDVRNSLPFDVVLYWIDDSTHEHRIAELSAGHVLPQQTFIGHIYIARKKDGGQLVDWWSMSGGQHAKEVEDRARTVESQCQADSHKCQTAEEALFDYIYHASFAKRHALNTVQPTIAHNYTARGFVKLPVPESTFHWLRAWYDENSRAEIEETNAGAVGTQHEAPWFVRHVPPTLKARLASELRPVLAEWSGFDADVLSMTSCYGIRRYSRGAQLRMHVDTMMTHVVSAIINVDQQVDSDWPIEIKNHDGIYEYINMKPGEMLFYESAKCLHGRPQKLDGDGYSNIFLHFQPSEPSLWPYSWY